MKILSQTSGVVLCILLFIGFTTCKKTESVHTERASQNIINILQQDFLISEAITIINKCSSRSSSRQYFASQQNRFNFVATQEQPPMIVDGYSVQDLTSPIIGYSLFFYGTNGSLVILDATVNHLNKDAVENISKLIKRSLDSVSNPNGSKMHFLGIYELDASRLLKIMVRKGQTPMGYDYAIRYAVSEQ